MPAYCVLSFSSSRGDGDCEAEFSDREHFASDWAALMRAARNVMLFNLSCAFAGPFVLLLPGDSGLSGDDSRGVGRKESREKSASICSWCYILWF